MSEIQTFDPNQDQDTFKAPDSEALPAMHNELDALNEKYPGLIDAIPDEADKTAFLDGIAGLPTDMQELYYKRIGHTLNDADPVTATTGRGGILFELRRIKSIQESGDETIDFEAAKDVGDVAYMGYSKKADINGAPDKALTSPVDCDVPISRDGKPHIYEVKSFPRMPFGSNAAKRNQVLKYQQAISNGAVEGASIEIKGRVDPSFVKWATGSQETPSIVPDVELLYTIDLPSGAEYTVVLKPGTDNKGVEFRNPDISHELDKSVIAGIRASEADGTLAALITAEDTSSAPDEIKAYVERPMDIKTVAVFNEYVGIKRAALYDRFIAKGDQSPVLQAA